MAKYPSKGTALSVEVATLQVAIAQMTDVGHDGAESQFFDCTTLDGQVGRTKTPTGFSNGGTFSGSGYMDLDDPGQKAITDIIAAPARVNCECTLPDIGGGARVMDFVGAGFQFGFAATLDDGITFDVGIEVSGLVNYAGT